MKIICIYKIKIKSKPNKIYIGSSTDFIRRKINHIATLKKNIHANSRLQKIFNDHGISDFSFEIVERIYDKNLLIQREQFYINTLKPTINILKIAGSCLGLKMSDEAKQKISKANSGRIFTDEHKKKLSDSHKGLIWSTESKKKLSEKNIGKKHTIESRKNMSKAQTGRTQSTETKLKLSKIFKGIKISEETKLKISKSHTGLKRPPRSEQWKIKQRESQKKS